MPDVKLGNTKQFRIDSQSFRCRDNEADTDANKLPVLKAIANKQIRILELNLEIGFADLFGQNLE